MKSEVLREWVRRFSEEDMKFLNSRYAQMMSGDRAVILDILSRNQDLDKYFKTAISAEELFDMIDEVGDVVRNEYSRRSGR